MKTVTSTIAGALAALILLSAAISSAAEKDAATPSADHLEIVHIALFWRTDAKGALVNEPFIAPIVFDDEGDCKKAAESFANAAVKTPLGPPQATCAPAFRRR